MRVYVIASILIIVGLITIAIKESLSIGNAWIPYLSDISSTLLIGGLLSLLFRVFQDKEYEHTLRRLMRIHDSVDELGLCEIMPEVQGYNFTTIIHEAQYLTIVMNDGLRWIGNNAVALQERFSKIRETDFYLVDPDSAFISSLALKTSASEEDLKRKIRDSWQRIKDAWDNSDKRGVVRIHRIKTYPTKSMFLTEDQLIESPYQTASGRATIPLFVYEKVARQDSLYQFASHDISEMRKEAVLEVQYG